MFEPLGDGAFAAAHRPEQIQNLLALFEALGRVAEETHHLLDGIFHAIKLVESGVSLDDLVGEQAREARVIAGVEHFGLANGGQHALRCRGVSHGVALALRQVLIDAELFFTVARIPRDEIANCVHTTSFSMQPRLQPGDAVNG